MHERSTMGARGRGLLWLLVACGGSAEPLLDLGPGSDGGEECGRVCDDGAFCNGVERCAPRADAADDDGCIPGTPPCSRSQVCDEEGESCRGVCVDADDDGFDDAACGGSDCDDTNPDVNPGRTELCDRMGVDEDCNPETLGPDGDGDGFVDLDCCQRDDRGALSCGLDCNDALSGVNPGVPDTCGSGDQDCDGRIDEEPDTVWYRDFDSDGFGRDDDTLAACSLPPGYALMPGDCDDDLGTNPRANLVFPGAEDVCNEVDDDCDMTVDERPAGSECECTTPGVVESCGLADASQDGVGICRLGARLCTEGGVFDACTGAVAPETRESCDIAERDEDCDGESNEGCECFTGIDQFCSETGSLGVCAGGLRSCVDGVLGPCSVARALEVCDAALLDEDCDGESNEGCDCVNGDVQSCGTALGSVGACAAGSATCVSGRWTSCSVSPSMEVCDAALLDEDCDGTPNEGCSCVDGETIACGSNEGRCEQGTQSCVMGAYSLDCVGEVGPIAEVCDGSIDDDCDGVPDDGCDCTNGDTRDCGMTAVGACELGTETCADGAWGPCTGEVAPRSTEVCGGGDADCDGEVDETSDVAPAAGAVRCYPDLDGDGFGRQGATGVLRCSCETDETDGAASDCNDSNDEVFPGQTDSFVNPHCPPGFEVCPDSAQPRGVGCVVAGTPCSPGISSATGLSWDYDCDTTERITVFLSAIRSCSAPLACTGSGETVHWQQIVDCGPVPTTGGIPRTSFALACESMAGVCTQTSASTPGVAVGAARGVPCR